MGPGRRPRTKLQLRIYSLTLLSSQHVRLLSISISLHRAGRGGCRSVKHKCHRADSRLQALCERRLRGPLSYVTLSSLFGLKLQESIIKPELPNMSLPLKVNMECSTRMRPEACERSVLPEFCTFRWVCCGWSPVSLCARVNEGKQGKHSKESE